MRKIALFSGLFVLLVSCVSVKKRVEKKVDQTLKSNFYGQQFTGLLVVDPISKDTLYNQNSEKYFTPASNTKIFTLYTALKTLPNAMPALKYIHQNDTLYFEGTGDPSFLHPYLKDSTAYRFLKQQRNLAFYTDNFRDTKFGPGWSWDDYHWYYSPERSAFPLFGNVVTITGTDDLKVFPDYFKDSVLTMKYSVNREAEKNIFYFDAERKDTLEIPFRTDTNTIRNILEQTLGKKIRPIQKMPEGPKNTLSGMPSDSLYVRLMHESDNFLAEQLLILATSKTTDTLTSAKARDYILENDLANLPQRPRWVDGSGLSRYNLFTPQSMVHVLQKLHLEIPKERLFAIFPAGGVSGTLENWYGNSQEPYVYAKSGSLGNNYCLSGYLITKSGKTLIFSFMNNHFMRPSSEVKLQIQKVLETLRDNY